VAGIVPLTSQCYFHVLLSDLVCSKSKWQGAAEHIVDVSGAPHRQIATCGRRRPLSSDGVVQFLHCVNNGKHFVNMPRANPNWLFVRRWLDASSGLNKAGFYKWRRLNLSAL